MIKRLAAFCLVLYGAAALALFSGASWGASDDWELSGLANARIIDSVSETRQQHPLIFSAMKKVNGVVKADSELWLDGVLSRKLYQLAEGQTSFSAYEYFTDQFAALGVTPVYQCQRFQCGDSSFWANNLFKLPLLYGLDREQAYYIGRRIIAGKTVYYSVYTIKRGNRKSYALVDIFRSATGGSSDGGGALAGSGNSMDSSAETLYLQMQRQGYAYLSTADKTVQINEIASILSNHKTLTLIVSSVSPLLSVPSSLHALDQDMAASKARMESLKTRLQAAGFDETRFRIIQGGLQPGLTAETQWLLIPVGGR